PLYPIENSPGRSCPALPARHRSPSPFRTGAGFVYLLARERARAFRVHFVVLSGCNGVARARVGSVVSVDPVPVIPLAALQFSNQSRFGQSPWRREYDRVFAFVIPEFF